MTPKCNGTSRDGWHTNTGELFNVILVYEDRACAQRGLALYQRLISDLGVESEFNLNVWKFAVLGLARLDEISTEQAAAADLVIVCTRGESGPTEPVQAWFERWLELKGHDDCALVVFGDTAEDSSAPVRQAGFFHGLAQRGGVGCLPRQSRATGTTGWLHDDRRSAPACLNRFSLATISPPHHARILSSLLG